MATQNNPERIGRYQILERVGRGGMGLLYRAIDPVLDREVAIKLMLVDFSEDPEQLRPRFYREARAAAKLQHPNIVTIFEFAEEGTTPYIVMEFLRGMSLAARMSAPVPLTLDQKLGIVAQLCDALHYAHEQGVVHRDVKPANIFILGDGSAKLLDFGVAKMTSSTLTRTGDVLGSASYMSPEQVSGSESLDGRSDVFSAGVVLYELLAGRKPFQADAPTATILKILNEDPPLLETLAPNLPPPLTAAAARALAKDPGNRFATAGELAKELRLMRRMLQASADGCADLEETRFATPAEMMDIRSTGQTPPPAGRQEPAAPAVPARAGAPSRTFVWGAAALAVVGLSAWLFFLGSGDRGATPEVASEVPAGAEASTAGPETPDASPASETAAASGAPVTGAATLTIRQMAPGTSVSMDKSLIGTVGGDGTLSYGGVRPGRRTMQFSRPGYEPVTLTRDFTAAQPLLLSPADVTWRLAPVEIEVLAESNTEVTISLGQDTVHQFTGPGRVPLAAGTYQVVARGPSGISTSETITVSAGGARAIDLRSIASGMEAFDGAGWTQKEAWFIRRGGGFVTYNRTSADARIGFTVRTDRSRNPFSSGPRLKWVVGYADARNHVLLELANDYFYRTEVVNGNRRELPRVAHKMPLGSEFLHVSVEISGRQVVHQSNAGPGWTLLDSWDTVLPAGGRFGFHLPGNETLEVTNFRYDPALTR